MERNFYNEEFEHFLKQKSDQYKMYPSDRVWNNVYNSLHNTRKWLGLGFLFLLIGGALLVSREVFLSKYNQVAQQVNQNLITPFSSAVLNTNNEQKNNLTVITPGIKRFKTVSHFNTTTAKSVQQHTNTAAAEQRVSNNTSSLTPENTEPGNIVIENNLLPANITGTHTAAARSFRTQQIRPRLIAENKIVQPDNLITNNYTGNIGSLKPSGWSFQLYASPIVSYRRLADLSRSKKYAPVAINYSGNIDDYVRHKPALGFELGTKLQYKISNNLYVYAGAQLNYSRYYIDAYKFHPERATIALSNSRIASMPDTLADYTNIRNFQGYSPEQLQNQYFQVSVPIGAELKLLGNNRLQLSIAGSVQPTYLISSTSYLISSDYKNYIQNPDLTRRWNVHTNVEAFVSYKIGGLKWQLGPQFRYQFLSSYSDKYPIREYLTEFGIKLGITKTIW